jgi:dihydrofolate synthase/folylpolyglutamate synthase
LDVLATLLTDCQEDAVLKDAIIHTALRTGFRGRWEKVSDEPYVICDIGHNEHGLKYNFSQLSRMKEDGECSDLIIVYGSVADKDVDAVIGLFPENAVMVFTQASSARALPASVIKEKYLASCQARGRSVREVHVCEDVRSAVEKAYGVAVSLKKTDAGSRPLVYIGGSTYVVAEAEEILA